MHGLVPHDPACPRTAPMTPPRPAPTKVTDTGWKSAAGGSPLPAVDRGNLRAGWAADDAGVAMVELPRLVLGDPVPTRAGPPDGPLSKPCATCGRIATAATITAAPPAGLTALIALRL